MTTTVPTPGSEAPELIAAGDADLLAERYDEALANYRAALAADSGDEALGHKLRRAEEAAASAVNRGEQQTRVFEDRLSQVASGDVLVPAPDLPAPGASVRARRDPGDAVRVHVGRVVGAGGLGGVPPPDRPGRPSWCER